MTQKVWLITGCSSGLGKELVQCIIQRGDKAIATARNISSLKELENIGAATIELDITASEDILKQKVEQAIGAFGHIDVVVHNAGGFQMGSWEDLTHELLQKQLHTNFFGPVNLTRALLPHFRERKDGTVIFIGSTSTWLTYGGVSAYGASKAALERMAEGLAAEAGMFGVKVLCVDAGGFDSQLVRKAPDTRPPGQHYEQLADAIQGAFQWLNANPASDTGKIANLLVDLVRSEGVAKGKEIPVRFPKAPNDLFEEWATMGPNVAPLQLPVGSDAIDTIKAKCEATLRIINQWEEIIRSTDSKAKTADT